MNLGIVVFNEVEELDFVGPWEMFSLWKKYADGPENCILVGQTLAPIMCAKSMSINPHASFADCPPLDYLLVPGGQGTRTEVGNPALIDFISKQARHCKAVLSVCTGAFVLHAAGLLAGKKATTHWNSLERLRVLGDVEVIEQRFVQDGNVWTSAGVSAGTDMALAFIANEAGEETAGKVQFAAEYYPSSTRYGNFDRLPQAPKYLKD
jgi:transcriptional regulator GlxA family with amidase domain